MVESVEVSCNITLKYVMYRECIHFSFIIMVKISCFYNYIPDAHGTCTTHTHHILFVKSFTIHMTYTCTYRTNIQCTSHTDPYINISIHRSCLVLNISSSSKSQSDWFLWKVIFKEFGRQINLKKDKFKLIEVMLC